MNYSMLIGVLVQAMHLVGPFLLFLTWKQSISITVRFGLIGLYLVYGIAPLLLGPLGMFLADQWNCTLEIGLAFTCPNKPEMSDLVTGLAYMPLLAIVTIPWSLLGILGLLILPMLAWIQRFRQTSNSLGANPLNNLSEGGEYERVPGQWCRAQGSNAILGGVCAGIARRFGVNALWVRVLFVACAVCSPAIAIVTYGILRQVIPVVSRSENL